MGSSYRARCARSVFTSLAAMAGLWATALPTTVLAQDSVTLFGGADLGVRRVSNSAGTQTKMHSGNNYTSRFGLRGTEDLGGGTKASFWLESSVNATSGGGGAAGSQFWDRRATLSLSGRFGELRLGRDYTPMFRAFAGTDAFGYVGVAGMGTLYRAGSSTTVDRAFGTGATSIARANSALQYYTPGTLGGFYFNGMYADKGGGASAGDFDFWGARAGYAKGSVDVSLFSGATRIESTGKRFRLHGAAGRYTFGSAKVLLSGVQIRYLNAKQTNYTLGLDWRVGTGQVLASYHRINQAGFGADGSAIDRDDADVFGVGYVHHLSKRTAIYGTAAYVRNKANARFVLPGGVAGAAPGRSSRGVEVGLRHIF